MVKDREMPSKLSFKDIVVGHNYQPSQDCEEWDNDGLLEDNLNDEGLDSNGDSEEDCQTISISSRKKKCLHQSWKLSLICKVLGKRMAYSFLSKRLQLIWKTKATITIIDLENDFFLVRFSNQDDYDHVRFDDPWVITDHYSITQDQKPNFNLENAGIDKAIVWVRFPNLPIEHYDKLFLWRLRNRLGKIMRTDEHRELRKRKILLKSVWRLI